MNIYKPFFYFLAVYAAVAGIREYLEIQQPWKFRLVYKCNGIEGKIVQNLSGGNLNFICQQKLYTNNHNLIQGCKNLTILESFCGRE